MSLKQEPSELVIPDAYIIDELDKHSFEIFDQSGLARIAYENFDVGVYSPSTVETNNDGDVFIIDL